jgi:type I restriction enzyme M protein
MRAARRTPGKRETGLTSDLKLTSSFAADKLGKNLEPSDYKHVVLGLIFLRQILQAFETKSNVLLADDPSAAEHPDENLADNAFWVPKEARWTHL